jgi:hypothetical protein
MLMLIIHRFLILKVCMQKQCAATMKQMLRTSAGHGVQSYYINLSPVPVEGLVLFPADYADKHIDKQSIAQFLFCL